MVEIINACKFAVGKPEGKRLLERPRCRWKNNTQTDIKEIWLGVWIGFIWLRIGNAGGLCQAS
jgi:hypothetical protein